MIDLDTDDSLDLSQEDWRKQRVPASSASAQGVQPADSDQSTYEDRLSVGRRLAGAVKQPSYMPATGQPPDPTAAPETRAPFDPNLLPESIRPKTLPTPSEVPPPPTGRNNPTLTDLARQQAAVSTPINPVDPATGKNKPQYDLGRAGRIIGTISNALGAFGAARTGVPFKAMDVSPSATNSRFSREESTREGQLEGVNTQIKTQEQLDAENEKLYRDATRQAYEGQLGEARLGTSKAQQEAADAKKQLADFKVDQPPVNKIGDAAEQRTALADKMNLKGQARTDYILTGKLPKEFTNPNAPRGSKFDFDKIEKDKGKAFADAEKRASAALTKLNKPPDYRDPDFNEYLNNRKGWLEGKKQEIYDTLDKEKGQAQSEYEARIQEKGGTVSAPGAPAPQKTAAPQAPPQVGATVLVDGKPHKVVGWNAKTKKPIVSPQ